MGNGPNDKVLDRLSHKTILVTGGAGFIGSHVVEAITSSSASVLVLDNLSTGSLSNLGNCMNLVKVIRSNIRFQKAFKEIIGFGKADYVFHLAALSLLQSFKDPIQSMQVNIGGTINVLEYARAVDAKVVFASTGSVYGNPLELPISESHPCRPISPYGASKLSAEEYVSMYVRTYGLEACSLRYFNVFGPRQRVGEETGVIPIFVHNALSNNPLKIFGSGKQTRDFLHVADVVRANLLAAANIKSAKGEAMNIGGVGQEVSVLELSDLIGNMLRRKVSIVYKAPKLGDISRLVADSSKANKLIGFKAKIELREGLADYIRWYQSSSQNSSKS